MSLLKEWDFKPHIFSNFPKVEHQEKCIPAFCLSSLQKEINRAYEIFKKSSVEISEGARVLRFNEPLSLKVPFFIDQYSKISKIASTKNNVTFNDWSCNGSFYQRDNKSKITYTSFTSRCSLSLPLVSFSYVKTHLDGQITTIRFSKKLKYENGTKRENWLSIAIGYHNGVVKVQYNKVGRRGYTRVSSKRYYFHFKLIQGKVLNIKEFKLIKGKVSLVQFNLFVKLLLSMQNQYGCLENAFVVDRWTPIVLLQYLQRGTPEEKRKR